MSEVQVTGYPCFHLFTYKFSYPLKVSFASLHPLDMIPFAHGFFKVEADKDPAPVFRKLYSLGNSDDLYNLIFHFCYNHHSCSFHYMYYTIKRVPCQCAGYCVVFLQQVNILRRRYDLCLNLDEDYVIHVLLQYLQAYVFQ